MLKNYLKIALSNIVRYKSYSLINIIGLAVGIVCIILIVLWIQDELSYDQHHKNAKRIYRVGTQFGPTVDSRGAYTAPPMAAELINDFPEIEAITRICFWYPNILVQYKEKHFFERRIIWADSSLFNVFTIPFIKGNPKKALTRPGTIVITESTAKKYFGEDEPIGKSILFDNAQNMYLITGVIEDCPRNSHFQYDFIASMLSHSECFSDSWQGHCYMTYLLLQQGYLPSHLEAKFPDFIIRHYGPQFLQDKGIPYEDYLKQEQNYYYGYWLQPLLDIYLNADIHDGMSNRGDRTYVYIFSIIAFLILVLACVNFINLSTARSAKRTKEVGMRKVVGANKLNLVNQFLSESILFALLALMLAAVLAEIFLPIFNNIIGRTLTLNFFDNWLLSFALIGIALIVGLISGSYPAFYLASFQPATILKSPAFSQSSNSAVRKFLVVFQFAISIILIIGTLIIYRQMHYMRTTDLGYNHNQILVTQLIRMDKETISKYHTLKSELLNSPNIINASVSRDIPSFSGSSTVILGWEGSNENDRASVNINYIDDKFMDTYGIQLIEGRNFFPSENSDSIINCIINESAVKRFGWDNAIGKRLGGNRYVIGIVKDFHFASLRFQINPLVLFPPDESNPTRQTRDLLSIKIASDNIDQTLKFIKNKFESIFPNEIFAYRFFDEDFDIMYHQEIQEAKTIGYFSILAIFIACLGLFGLASFMAEQRTKEIGVRKALGASIPGIFLLLSKEFTKWILLATIIAWPVGYFVMNKWLQDFAYRVNMEILIFILSGIMAVLIALVTVSYQAIKAAVANPVESLKYE